MTGFYSWLRVYPVLNTHHFGDSGDPLVCSDFVLRGEFGYKLGDFPIACYSVLNSPSDNAESSDPLFPEVLRIGAYEALRDDARHSGATGHILQAMRHHAEPTFS